MNGSKKKQKCAQLHKTIRKELILCEIKGPERHDGN